MARFERGQSLAEFMILLSVIIVYFLVFTGIYGSQRQMQFEITDAMQAKETGELFAAASSEVYLSGNGSTVSFFLDNALQNISMVGNTVQIQRLHNLVQVPAISSAVSGNFSPGQKTISNVNGNVSVS